MQLPRYAELNVTINLLPSGMPFEAEQHAVPSGSSLHTSHDIFICVLQTLIYLITGICLYLKIFPPPAEQGDYFCLRHKNGEQYCTDNTVVFLFYEEIYMNDGKRQIVGVVSRKSGSL